MPFAVYFFWLVIYGLVNFVLAADLIKRRNYENLYNHLKTKPAVNKIINRLGPKVAPLAFLGGHAVFWFTCHLMAIVQFQSYWISHAFLVYWLYVAIWNGSCYYMDYFARKYEV